MTYFPGYLLGDWQLYKIDKIITIYYSITIFDFLNILMSICQFFIGVYNFQNHGSVSKRMFERRKIGIKNRKNTQN